MAKIDSSDLDYHKFVYKQVNDAQAVSRAWGQYLFKKYKLNPENFVDENGEIKDKNNGQE